MIGATITANIHNELPGIACFVKPDFVQTGLLCLILCLVCQDLIGQTAVRPDQMRLINPSLPQPIPIDFEQLDALGVRVLESDHLLLLTDIKDRADIDELTTVFDAAVDQWCQYFDIDRERAAAWKLRGMVIADREKFDRAALIPKDLPDFPAGYQRGHEMWVYLQRGKYYTRHLLLHEGTHSFMQWFLNGTGAPWYSEGMAELLGVHRWLDGQLTLNHQLRDRSEAEYWGRIKLIQQDCAAGKALSIADVLYFAPEVFRDVRYYAWSWAACEFLSRHPLSKREFAKLQLNAHLAPGRFNQKFEQSIAPARAELERDWSLFVNEIDFGYDIDRGRLRTITAESNATDNFRIDAGFSWQATPFSVVAGERFRFIGSGRFTEC